MQAYVDEPVPMQLVLKDGKVFDGFAFGAVKETKGEVVFNTGMTGYVETLTDPSYRGQLLTLTYPLQGNYGVPNGPFEAPLIQIEGLLVSHYSERPWHHASARTLSAWLKAEGIPAICGIDTRSLTRHLRALGTISGGMRLVNRASVAASTAQSRNMRKILDLVDTREIVRYGNGKNIVLLIDTGTKENIVRSLLKRDTTVIRASWSTNWESFLDEVDGVILTNGPGDPSDASPLVERVRALLSLNLPVFGICFGHQMLSMAAGAKTFKMPYGNRSVNQPVRDLVTGRCYITSQNHGYVVQTESLPSEFVPWFVNLNDHSNEGIRHTHKPIRSVQFHPEASPGPNDTAFLFDDFIAMLEQNKKETKPSSLLYNLKERTAV